MAIINADTINAITEMWGPSNGYPDWLVPFMLSYAQMPIITKAASECGKAYFTVKEYIKSHPDVDNAMHELHAFAIGDLKEELFRRAKISDSLLQFALKSYDPEQFGSKVDVSSGGKPLKTYVTVSPEDWDDHNDVE